MYFTHSTGSCSTIHGSETICDVHDPRLLLRPYPVYANLGKALARMRGCADSPEPSLVARAMSTYAQ